MSGEFTVPAADTRLRGIDIPGPEPALLFLNGAFATLHHWKPVLLRLSGRYRVVAFDARGRGRSGTSSDYSVHGAVDDVGRVIETAGLERPVLVAWSHGATVAVRYAALHPERVRGLVLVDGAYPIAMFDEAGKEKVRAQFRRLGWIMRVLALFGRSAKMSPAQSARLVIEMDEVNGDLASSYAALRCPAVFVVASGGHGGSPAEESARMRAAVAQATASSEYVTVFATTKSNHVQVVAKDAEIVVAAIDDVVKRT
jgi:pimeloyl-ACP methyl ester carboxylesterase